MDHFISSYFLRLTGRHLNRQVTFGIKTSEDFVYLLDVFIINDNLRAACLSVDLLVVILDCRRH